jgi:iron-sulfur cluster assembly protein
MIVELTEKAAEHIRTMLDKRGHGTGLRLSTKESGCSGYAYVVDYADDNDITDDDVVFESHGASVVVDKKSLQLIDGLEIDYVKHNPLDQGFEFRNPNVKNMCGCGESFTV